MYVIAVISPTNLPSLKQYIGTRMLINALDETCRRPGEDYKVIWQGQAIGAAQKNTSN